MIELELTDEGIAYGKRVVRTYDEQQIGDKFRTDGVDKRWTGHAVEFEFDRYLATHFGEHVWNGGLDDKPDFELGGVGIALKANTGPAPDPGFVFVIPKDQASKLASVAIFAICNPRDRKIYLAGAIHSRNFRQVAELRRKGDEGPVPGRRFFHDCWVIRQLDLTDVDLFLNLMGVAGAA